MITFINPPSPFLINDRAFVPLGILYVATALKAKGYPIEFIDLSKNDKWEIEVSKIRTECICITGTTPHFSILKDISKILRKVSPNSKLIVGGPHATVDPDSLTPYYDVVIKNEGENVIEHALYNSEHIIDGGIVKDLDTIPYPHLELLDLSSYEFLIDNKSAVHMMLSRGCVFNCSFCCSVNHRRLRFRSVRDIVGEIKVIQIYYNIHRFMFFNDTFLLKESWTISFCDAVKPLKIKWRCFIRADNISINALQIMKEAGCVEIGVGVESGSQKILDNVDKKIKVEDSTKLRKLCKEVGILFKAFLIIGLPGETESTFQETKNWMLENKPDKYSIFLFTPYPGSPIYNNPEQYDYEFTADFDYDKLWWGGIMSQQISVSRTKELTAERIVYLRNSLLKDLKEAGLDDMNNII